jgi:hypothetical protein
MLSLKLFLFTLAREEARIRAHKLTHRNVQNQQTDPHAFRSSLSSYTHTPLPVKLRLVLLQSAHLGLCARSTRVDLASGADGSGKVLEDRDCVLPVDACIRDANAALETGRTLSRDLLVALVDVGLDHDADNGSLALAQLVGNGLGNLGLVVVVLLRVAYVLLDPIHNFAGQVFVFNMIMAERAYRENSQS